MPITAVDAAQTPIFIALSGFFRLHPGPSGFLQY